MWNKGFTLLELLIVLALISILTALAYTSYQPVILKARRLDAQSTLLNYHLNLQKCFVQKHDYEQCARDLDLFVPRNSLEQFYQVQVVDSTQATFMLEAKAQGLQQEDENCWRFTLNQALQREAYSMQGTKNIGCWPGS